ncbi:MAG: FecR domain-containing protein [Chitinophagaceae bacterium]
MESPERIWQLIAKALNDEASSQEKAELFHLLQQDPALQQQYELLTRIWNEKHDLPGDEEDAKKHISRIITRAETEKADEEIAVPRRRRRRIRIVTYSLLILVLISGGLYLKFFQTKSINDVLVAKNGSRTRSLLADGTTVWLNAGSKLFVENDFNGATREVLLEGEAFFDVVKKPGQPFIVHTSGIDIKVLGTAFNVKAYPEDSSVETTLYRGIVQVFRQEDANKKPIELKPNEKLVLLKKAATEEFKVSVKNSSTVIEAMPRFVITQIDSTKKENERIETAWVYSRLEFRGDKFEDLAHKLERWYNVTIIFTDEKVKQLPFNGSFEKETVEEAFAALKVAYPIFTYQINKNEISVGSSQ